MHNYCKFTTHNGLNDIKKNLLSGFEINKNYEYYEDVEYD